MHIPSFHPARPGWAALAAAAVLLGGCATPPSPPYRAPIDGPTARVLTRASVAAGDRFGLFVVPDNQTCKGPQIAGRGTATSNPPAVMVQAGAPRTVDFVLLRANKSLCLVRWTFTPQANKTYLIAGRGTPTGCSAALMDATDPDQMTPERSAVLRNNGNQGCVPLAQARPAPGTSTAGTGSQDAVLRHGATDTDLQGLIGK